jgi:PST family polysaccharide transporter
LAVASPWVSKASFGNDEHTIAIAVLASTIAANLWSNYFVATVQAAGRIERVATNNIASGVAGALVAIVSFPVWRRTGIVIAIVGGAFVQTLLSWRISRETPFPEPDAGTTYSAVIASRLAQVGGLVVGIGMLSNFGQFLVRAVLMRGVGEEGAGIFQSAYALSGMYANYVLGAMGTDYLPRVSAVINDDEATFRLVNEQTAVALLLGLPGRAPGDRHGAHVHVAFFARATFARPCRCCNLWRSAFTDGWCALC